jgi:uncharacterized protein (UPF0332 family)
VTPEAERFLQNADDHLERGQTILAAGLNYDAGRAAYLAAFHAAQAIDLRAHRQNGQDP